MIVSKKELGQLVKKARSFKSDKCGKMYTQKMLAQDIQKSQSYIGDIESGRTYPSFVLLTSIANACEVSMNFFDPKENLDIHIENFINKQLANMPDKEMREIKQQIKEDPRLKINHICPGKKTQEKCPLEFQDAREIMDYITSLKAFQDYVGIDFNKLTPDELAAFENDVLQQVKLISYKYK